LAIADGEAGIAGRTDQCLAVVLFGKSAGPVARRAADAKCHEAPSDWTIPVVYQLSASTKSFSFTVNRTVMRTSIQSSRKVFRFGEHWLLVPCQKCAPNQKLALGPSFASEHLQ
jgi:hypothetical protein